MAAERIQKVLAQAGFGSRRMIESWIQEGRVVVNGRISQLGDRLDPKKDQVTLDGAACEFNLVTQSRVILYHKPVGEICTRFDDEGRRTVFESLPDLEDGRWVPVGRLDINTSGLLLFTNDGEWAHRLMHPRFGAKRVYLARIGGVLSEGSLKSLRKGVQLEDGVARCHSIRETQRTGSNAWYQVTMTEGRHRIVRRLMEAQGACVNRLMRIQFGSFVLPRSLQSGQWAEVPHHQLKEWVST